MIHEPSAVLYRGCGFAGFFYLPGLSTSFVVAAADPAAAADSAAAADPAAVAAVAAVVAAADLAAVAADVAAAGIPKLF